MSRALAILAFRFPRVSRWLHGLLYVPMHADDDFSDKFVIPATEPPREQRPFLSAPRVPAWVPARNNYRVPCAADTAIDAIPRDWLQELIEHGLGGYASPDEWVRARRRQLAMP